MPNPSKRKGNKGEYQLRDILRKAGIPARRVPQSGSSPDMKGDLLVSTTFPIKDWATGNTIEMEGPEQTWEVKRRSSGFKRLYAWLQDCDVVAFRGDRSEWLVCLRLQDWINK